MSKYILTVNSGSATLKMAVFDQKLKQIWEGQVEKIGQSDSFLFIEYNNKEVKKKKRIANHRFAFKSLISFIDREILDNICSVGHRVVHGGSYYSKPTKIDASVIKNIKKLADIAPLHNPKNLATILSAKKHLRKSSHFALFDTAFHQSILPEAFTYSLPKSLTDKYGIRKYGFHGLSHQYCVEQAAKKLNKPINKLNLITIHLGNGASVTAIKNGKSIDTSMGFTPLEGLTMGTRTGDIDPGIIFYLLKKGIKYKELDKIFNYESGISGLFGSQDMRDVLTVAGYKIPGYTKSASVKATKKDAQFVLDIFVYDVLRYVHAYFGMLKNIDAVVFTGGIGERNSDMRKLIMKNCIYKGKVLVVKANEEYMMAKLISKKK
jgi:acetate kinase